VFFRVTLIVYVALIARGASGELAEKNPIGILRVCLVAAAAGFGVDAFG